MRGQIETEVNDQSFTLLDDSQRKKQNEKGSQWCDGARDPGGFGTFYEGCQLVNSWGAVFTKHGASTTRHQSKGDSRQRCHAKRTLANWIVRSEPGNQIS